MCSSGRRTLARTLAHRPTPGHFLRMPLIDRTRQPQAPARKTKGVKIVRAEKNGQVTSVRSISAQSDTLSDYLRYVFSRNVKDATKKR